MRKKPIPGVTPEMSFAAMCNGKAGYVTAAKAWEVLRRRNGRRGKKRRTNNVEPYRCVWCHQWHIGGKF